MALLQQPLHQVGMAEVLAMGGLVAQEGKAVTMRDLLGEMVHQGVLGLVVTVEVMVMMVAKDRCHMVDIEYQIMPKGELQVNLALKAQEG